MGRGGEEEGGRIWWLVYFTVGVMGIWGIVEIGGWIGWGKEGGEWILFLDFCAGLVMLGSVWVVGRGGEGGEGNGGKAV